MAHRGYEDKNRREIALYDRRIKEILPDHFATDYPQFITFLEKYYEWIESEESPAELIDHLLETKDITETDDTLLSYLEDELLLGQSYFQGFPDKRAAAKISNFLYKSKGSQLSIQQFFRSFFQEDPDIVYTKESIFKLNESKLGADDFKFLTDDKLYQTYAILIKVGLPISVWEEVYKLFVHPAGFYLGGQLQIVSEVGFGPTPFDGYDDMDSAGPQETPAPLVSPAEPAFFNVEADNGQNHYAVFDSSRTNGLGEIKVEIDRYMIANQFEDVSMEALDKFTPTTLKSMGGFVVNGTKTRYESGGTPGVDYDSAFVPTYPTFDMDSAAFTLAGGVPDFSADSGADLSTYSFTTMDRA